MDNNKQPEKGGSFKRKQSLTQYKAINIGETKSYRAQFKGLREKLTDKNELLWNLMDTYKARDALTIQKSIISHVEYTLAKTRFDLTENVLYQGTALSVRDRLLESLNDSQMTIKVKNPKRLYYLSIEFLLGRLLQNALINMDLEEKYKEALEELGFKLEEIYEEEHDPALGNGGLGRLAACYLDSLTTLNYPAWGYGIRYDYGIFRQAIENFQQKEYPDYWLIKGNQWEIQRLDIKYKVAFFGYCKDVEVGGKLMRVWEPGQEVIAMAYDTPIPGWNTFNTNMLRLWKSFANEEFNFDSFNRGDFGGSMDMKDDASFITSVLYPNDSTPGGKELRLKQQYFFVCATITDIIRRFVKYDLPWREFHEKNAIQLNDTHPAIAIPELMRQLIDIYYLDFNEAFNIVNRTFAYTNHTVLPEALEKWSVELLGRLLPRHLEIIYLINHMFMESLRTTYPNDYEKQFKLSIIEECCPKMIRMANLSIISSHKVNGVAKIHSGLLKTSLFPEFHEYFPGKFTNVTNGVTPRRWICAAFPELSSLLTEYSGEEKDWLSDLTLIKEMPSILKSNNQIDEFVEKFAEAKLTAKLRMKKLINERTGIEIDEHTMFDVMVKRIHEYKRQLMNIFHWVHRYLLLKSMKPEEREKMVKRTCFIGGKAAPGYTTAKNFIRLANQVSDIINSDIDTNKYFKCMFIPNYCVSAAQIIIPSADLSQHISTAGTEASGTSNMKFAMTGSLIIGTKDGANIEIAQEIGEDNIFFFGKVVQDVDGLRRDLWKGNYVSSTLRNVVDNILSGKFGEVSYLYEYLHNLMNGGDFYLLCHDFDEYLDSQNKVDLAYSNKAEWYRKTLLSISRMGNFSSDRSIEDYASEIWNLTKVDVPKPVFDASKRVVSSVNLKSLDNEKK